MTVFQRWHVRTSYPAPIDTILLAFSCAGIAASAMGLAAIIDARTGANVNSHVQLSSIIGFILAVATMSLDQATCRTSQSPVRAIFGMIVVSIIFVLSMTAAITTLFFSIIERGKDATLPTSLSLSATIFHCCTPFWLIRAVSKFQPTKI